MNIQEQFLDDADHQLMVTATRVERYYERLLDTQVSIDDDLRTYTVDNVFHAAIAGNKRAGLQSHYEAGGLNTLKRVVPHLAQYALGIRRDERVDWHMNDVPLLFATNAASEGIVGHHISFDRVVLKKQKKPFDLTARAFEHTDQLSPVVASWDPYRSPSDELHLMSLGELHPGEYREALLGYVATYIACLDVDSTTLDDLVKTLSS